MPSAGHPGRDRTLASARNKYYWPTMSIDVEKHISQCLSCALTKGTASTAPILEYPLPAGPFDVVDIDLLQLPRSTQGSVYIIVCVDHFSRFVVLPPLRNKSIVTVDHSIVSHLICPYATLESFSVTMARSSRIRFYLTSAPKTISSRLSSLHTILPLMVLLKVLTGKYLRSYGTLHDTYTIHGKIGFRKSQILLIALSIYLQAKHHTTSFLGMTKDCLMTCFLNLPPPSITLRIILNYSSIAS